MTDRMTSRRVTLVDVARRAGVNRSTVSQVFAAHALGYTLNALARVARCVLCRVRRSLTYIGGSGQCTTITYHDHRDEHRATAMNIADRDAPAMPEK